MCKQEKIINSVGLFVLVIFLIKTRDNMQQVHLKTVCIIRNYHHKVHMEFKIILHS